MIEVSKENLEEGIGDRKVVARKIIKIANIT